MRADSVIQWKAYPALLLAGCFSVGLAAAASAPVLSFWHWAGTLGIGLSLGLLAMRYARNRLVSLAPLCWTVSVAFVAVASGGLRETFNHARPPNDIGYAVRAASSGTVEGRVSTPPRQTAYGLRFLLEARHLLVGHDTASVTGILQVVLSPARGASASSFPPISQGHLLRLAGTLKPPPHPRNPADFDYGRYLRRQGVSATLTLYGSNEVTVLGTDLPLAERLTLSIRRFAQEQLGHLVSSEPSRAILAALLLGDRSGIEDKTREQFARTGLLHLLAVSGLHVFFVGMLLYSLLGPLLTRLGLTWGFVQMMRSGGMMGLLVIYMFLTGAGASVVRAVVMAGLFVGGAVLQRPVNHLNALGVAALVLLLGDPHQLFAPGFQLSFAAVAAIVTLHPVFMGWLPAAWCTMRGVRHVLSTVSVSLAALLGTLPVQLFHFGQASAAGLLLNLVAIPATALSLGAGLLALLLAGVVPSLAGVFGEAATLLTSLLLATAEEGAQWFSWAKLDVQPGRLRYLPAIGAVLVMIAQAPRPRLRWRWAGLALSLATMGVWVPVLQAEHKPALEVVFFDVGHGDAALVSFPNGRRLLVDAGGRDTFTDHGVRTLLPHLERYGPLHLDAVVLSHPHSDHLGGLPALLRAVPVRRLFHNGQPARTALYAEMMHLLDSLGVAHQPLRAGDTLKLDPAVRLHILSPERREGEFDDANDASIVLRLTYGQHAFLFTGDAEAAAEGRILARYRPLLSSDVVKVGHHGSRTSSTPPFVAEVASKPNTMAVVSVGGGRRYGLPNADVLHRWREHGATAWITQERGALWLRSDGVHLAPVRWR